jgi:beta-keto acid cleavage enzyme
VHRRGHDKGRAPIDMESHGDSASMIGPPISTVAALWSAKARCRPAADATQDSTMVPIWQPTPAVSATASSVSAASSPPHFISLILELFREVVSGIKKRCDVIVQSITGGGNGMVLEERAAVLPEFRPEMATFNTGSFNFGLFPTAERGVVGVHS